MQDFVYECPDTMEEAVAAMRGGDARALAGGTDLIPQLREAAGSAGRVVDLKRIPELTAIAALPDGGVSIGAAANAHGACRGIGVASDYPAVAQSACLIGGVQVQNRASLGGNICNAAPSADAVPALSVIGARAVDRGANGRRELPLERLFTGPGKTILEPGELLVVDPAAAGRRRARRPSTCASRRAARWTSPSPASPLAPPRRGRRHRRGPHRAGLGRADAAARARRRAQARGRAARRAR